MMDRNRPDSRKLVLQMVANIDFRQCYSFQGVNIKISNLSNYNSPPTGGWTIKFFYSTFSLK